MIIFLTSLWHLFLLIFLARLLLSLLSCHPPLTCGRRTREVCTLTVILLSVDDVSCSLKQGLQLHWHLHIAFLFMCCRHLTKTVSHLVTLVFTNPSCSLPSAYHPRLSTIGGHVWGTDTMIDLSVSYRCWGKLSSSISIIYHLLSSSAIWLCCFYTRFLFIIIDRWTYISGLAASPFIRKKFAN